MVIAAMLCASACAMATAGAATAATTSTSVKYYLHSDGCGATNPQSFFLSTSATGHGDSGDGCGIIGGLPLGEAFYQLGVPTTTTFSTAANEPTLPLTLDASQPITGVIGTQSWTGVVGGAGQVTADVDVSAVDSNGNTTDLGSASETISALPTSSTYSIPFSVKVDPSLAGLQLVQVTISVTLHGLNENAAAEAYKGASYLVIP
jgi:hypothetical protein